MFLKSLKLYNIIIAPTHNFPDLIYNSQSHNTAAFHAVLLCTLKTILQSSLNAVIKL